MIWFTMFIYTMAVFGISLLFTKTIGPFAIFLRLRIWAERKSPSLGYLFKCMTCFPTNVGWVTSLLNWFLVPIAITPGRILFDGTNLWWAAMLLDACYCAGSVHFIANLDDFIDKSTPEVIEVEENGNDRL